MIIHYYNLGQCVGDRVVYIRSTDIEQANWHRLLWSVPDDWFYQWSIGNEIILHEKTSNANGGKVKRIFAPVLEDVLNYHWFKKRPTDKRLAFHYWRAIDAIEDDNSLKRKIHFWQGRILSDFSLIVDTERVGKEPNLLELR